MKTMKQMALEFSHAFGRPVNESPVQLTVTERELLGRLIFEECLEYVTKGLGLSVIVDDSQHYLTADSNYDYVKVGMEHFKLELNEGQRYDPIESADGLGDMNVLVHFNSLWHGFDIDAVTREIFRSNMSKLDESGKPIINGYSVGYRDAYATETNTSTPTNTNREDGFDPTKPIGKILKGPNYSPPDIAKVIGV